MASGSKSDSIFTGNPTGGKPGDSAGLVRSKGANVGGGGSILEAYPMDNVHGVSIGKTKVDDQRLGGSDTNLGHSLTGASMVPRQKGKVESSGI